MSANNTKKVILVTGASRGIGKACSVSLANKDSILILMARDAKSLNVVEKECSNLGSEVKCIAFDLADTKKIKDEVNKVINEYGRIDTLINNAGIWDEQPFESGDMDKWDHALDVNLKSAIHLTRYCLEGMSSEGAVIFIGSSASKKNICWWNELLRSQIWIVGIR